MCSVQAAREQWAETLWSNLNVQVLQEGIDTFLKNLRKLPREVKNMAVGRCLDEKLKEFRDSLPLFMDLKHEALRDRYGCLPGWEEGTRGQVPPCRSARDGYKMWKFKPVCCFDLYRCLADIGRT